jgi:hypothetical protein
VADNSIVAISLGGIADFVTAGSSQKLAVVRGLVDLYSSPYHPSRDFYGDIRQAIDDGILLGDDRDRVNAAVAECNVKRRDHYEAVASGWRGWRGRKNLERFADTSYWHEQQLAVRVSPRFVWRQTLNRDLVWPYFKDDELTRDGAQAAIRIMEMACPSEAGRPAILDVRRGRLHRARRRDRDYDILLRGQVSALLQMYEALRPAA